VKKIGRAQVDTVKDPDRVLPLLTTNQTYFDILA
jgi:hypothetical protein